jgi:hypothetical protein
MRKFLSGILLVSLTLLYVPSVFTGVCENLAAKIDSQTKMIALTEAESVNTIQQQTNKLLSVGNHQRLMQMNLELMAQHKCKPLQEVPSYV